MLKARSISSSAMPPARWMSVKSGGVDQARRSMTAAQPSVSTRGRFSVMPPPVMCAMPLIWPPPSSGAHDRQIGAVCREQRVADGGAKFIEVRVGRQSGHVEKHPARERVAVGVQTGRWQSNQHVAGDDATAIDDRRSVDSTDDEAADVIFAVRVKTRHLGGLSADQRAAVLAAGASHARHHLLCDIWRQPTGGEVVQEEQWHRALDEDVVDAVVDQVGADGVVLPRHERDLQLRADAIGAGHEHRLAMLLRIEREEAAKRANVGQHTGRVRRAGQSTESA